jgi:hypothetical protein
MWGEGETLNSLLFYHRLTGDERVLKRRSWARMQRGINLPYVT